MVSEHHYITIFFFCTRGFNVWPDQSKFKRVDRFKLMKNIKKGKRSSWTIMICNLFSSAVCQDGAWSLTLTIRENSTSIFITPAPQQSFYCYYCYFFVEKSSFYLLFFPSQNVWHSPKCGEVKCKTAASRECCPSAKSLHSLWVNAREAVKLIVPTVLQGYTLAATLNVNSFWVKTLLAVAFKSGRKKINMTLQPLAHHTGGQTQVGLMVFN